MARYLLFAKFTAEELARRTAGGFAEQEAQANAIWASVGGTVEAWFHGAAADDWDVVAIVTVESDALFAVANAMVGSGAIERSSFMELRTAAEADAAVVAFAGLRTAAS